jgi:putative transposase
MSQDNTPARVRWARLRFSILGPLFASPPDEGELAARLQALAAQSYRHPTTGEAVRFAIKTIERWYYSARDKDDPLVALERKVPQHAGTFPSLPVRLGEALRQQYREHPRWSYQLHYDNLRAVAKAQPELGKVPGYATVCRYMKSQGLLRQRHRPRREPDKGKTQDNEQRPAHERRSFEVAHVHALWHLDFHEGSRKVLCSSGEWKKPFLLGILDDHSRLCCHLQWYLQQDTEALVHGLSQAILKRGLPRALLTDNGGPMTSAETTEGLLRLGILHHTTLPYSPEQNGKQEHFWAQVEGRLMAMLDGVTDLSLSLLNTATQAWVEQEYHRRVHDEIAQTPLERYIKAPNLGRPSPSSETLRRAFRTEVTRKQRGGDGTTTVEGVRFEVPSAYRTLLTLRLRVARWDLRSVELVDPRSGAHLGTLLPLDKTKNADGVRRALPAPAVAAAPARSGTIAPHLRALMAEYAATGLPPAYLPKDDCLSPVAHDPVASSPSEPMA